MAGKKQEGKRNARRPKNRLPLLAAGLALLLVAAVAIYATAGQQGPNNVERFMHLHGLSVPAWAPEEVYVASHQGLAKIDAEGKWSFVSEVAHDFMGFQVNHTEEGVLYSSGHPAPGSNFPNPLGFMVSRDAGATWNIVSLRGEVDFHLMTVQSTNGDVIYGYSGGLMRSLDAGNSWERIDGNVARIGKIYALTVDPGDGETLWAGSSSGVWRSVDAGETWLNVVPQVPVTAIAFAGNRLWAYAVSSDAGLMLSEDEGENWRSVGFFVEEDDAVAYIAPRPGSREHLYVGSFGQHIYKSTDGGENWVQLAEAGVPQEHDDDHTH